MAQNQISYANKTDTTPSNTAQWTGPDVNEVKAVVNNNSQDAETRMTANAVGVANLDNTKVDKASNINKQAGNYTVVETDNNNIIEVNGTFTVTFDDGLSAGFSCLIVNTGTGTVTIAATSTINGKLSIDEQYSSAAVYQSDTNIFISI